MSQLPPGFVLDGAAPQAQGPVYGAPRPGPAPASPEEIARLKMEQDRLAIAQEEMGMKREERSDKQRKFVQARRDSIDSIIDTLRKIDLIEADAKDNGGFGETGRSGAFVRSLPGFVSAGTAGYDLKQQLGKIDAQSAFGSLQRMRDNSPTGGALGAITAPELELLKSSVAALDPDQSQETFISSLDEARQIYLRNLERVHPKAAEAYRRVKTRQAGGNRTRNAPARGAPKFLGFE